MLRGAGITWPLFFPMHQKKNRTKKMEAQGLVAQPAWPLWQKLPLPSERWEEKKHSRLVRDRSWVSSAGKKEPDPRSGVLHR